MILAIKYGEIRNIRKMITLCMGLSTILTLTSLMGLVTAQQDACAAEVGISCQFSLGAFSVKPQATASGVGESTAGNLYLMSALVIGGVAFGLGTVYIKRRH